MRTSTTASNVIDQFQPAEAYALFEATAQRYLNISGTEFLKLWDNGAYENSTAKTRAMRVAMLIPMVRTVSARQKSR